MDEQLMDENDALMDATTWAWLGGLWESNGFCGRHGRTQKVCLAFQGVHLVVIEKIARVLKVPVVKVQPVLLEQMYRVQLEDPSQILHLLKGIDPYFGHRRALSTRQIMTSLDPSQRWQEEMQAPVYRTRLDLSMETSPPMEDPLAHEVHAAFLAGFYLGAGCLRLNLYEDAGYAGLILQTPDVDVRDYLRHLLGDAHLLSRRSTISGQRLYCITVHNRARLVDLCTHIVPFLKDTGQHQQSLLDVIDFLKEDFPFFGHTPKSYRHTNSVWNPDSLPKQEDYWKDPLSSEIVYAWEAFETAFWGPNIWTDVSLPLEDQCWW